MACNWREVPRIGLPFWLLSRPFAVIANRLDWAVTEAERLVEPYAEQPFDKDGGRFQALLRSAALWLMQSPNDARQAILEQTEAKASREPSPRLLKAFEQLGEELDRLDRK